MTPDEHAAHFMREIAKDYGADPEACHGKGDDFLCRLLRDLGYTETVAEWEKLPKWYA